MSTENRAEGIYRSTKEEKKLAERIFLENLEDCERFPKYIQVETINACNARCPMCGVGKFGQPQSTHKMTMSEFKDFAEQISDRVDWIEMVTVVGRGEPLLDDTIDQKVNILSKMGIKDIQLSTNAELLFEERSYSLFENGLNDLRISIDSIIKKTYDTIRPGLHFERVMENAITAIKIRDAHFPHIPIRIRAVGVPENIVEKEMWIDFWKERTSPIDTVQFLTYNAVQNGIKTLEGGNNSPCVSLFSSIVIRSNGEVNLCYPDMLSEYVLGNIFEKSISEIWRSEKFRELRKMHLYGQRKCIDLCKNCVAWE